MRLPLPMTLTLTLATAVACTACAKPPEVIDPAVAGQDPDFHIQGEYVGEGAIGTGVAGPVGAQIVALGNGEFDVKLLDGGLPGAGWERGHESLSVQARRQADGTVTITGSDHGGQISDGVLTVTDADGKPLVELKQTVRTSPTLGQQPLRGAIVLFDGERANEYAEKWHHAQVTDMGTLLGGCTSKDQFPAEGYRIHLEFRTSWMPTARGQNRSNSGVYIHHMYECQVLDSFGLEGRANECGGFYNVQAPKVNMALPPLQWQTYDIDFTGAKFDAAGKKTSNARVTVRHNGVVIHDDLELPKATPGGKSERPGPSSLFLQGHGNKVQYRNIWLQP